MKVCFKGIKENFTPEKIDIIKKFILFIQGETPLKKDVYITFVNDRDGHMTTGVRKTHHKIKVLAHKRLLIDVLRTVAHEWVHEYQHQSLGLKEKKKYKEVGGAVENMANVLSGIFTKQFQKDNPTFDKELYDEK